MSSRNLQKEKKVADLQQDIKKETAVKLRRKESNNAKSAQTETQRKSVFRFLHRDKKKGPELPEHGFIPDARRVLENSSRSLTTQMVTSYPKNRWSSYEPLDFSKLSTCHNADISSKDLQKNIDPINSDNPSDNNDNSCFRSLSHESMTGDTPPPSMGYECLKEILSEEVCLSSENHKLHPMNDANVIIGERIKQIDEKLNDALMERRKILEQFFDTSFKSFPLHFCTSGVQTILSNSFKSSESLTKLACQSINSNGLILENKKVVKEMILELRKNLTVILDMFCSTLKDGPSSQSPPSLTTSLTKPFEMPDGREFNHTNIHTAYDISSSKCWQNQPSSDCISTGLQSSWSDSSVENLFVDGSTEKELEEILSEIDEENEDPSAIERDPPSQLLGSAHSPSQKEEIFQESPLTVLESELDIPMTSCQNADFEKESVISKSFSTSCFSDLKIHSSIAEEDEEFNSDNDQDIRSDEDMPRCFKPIEVSLPMEVSSFDRLDFDKNCDEGLQQIERPNHTDLVKVESFVEDSSHTINNFQSCSFDINTNYLMKNDIVACEKVDGKYLEHCICKKTTDSTETSDEKLSEERTTHNLINESSPTEPVGNVGIVGCRYPHDFFFQDVSNIKVDHQLATVNNISNEIINMPCDNINLCMVEDVPCDRDHNREFIGLNKPLYEVMENIPLETPLVIAETQVLETMNVLHGNNIDEELKVENIEILIYGEEKIDSIEDDNEDGSDMSTPVNSDSCDLLQETSSSGVNQPLDEESEIPIILKNEQVSLSTRSKKKNKRKKKKQVQQISSPQSASSEGSSKAVHTTLS